MIVIINPNSTSSMTEKMLKTARKAAPDCDFEGWTSQKGPAAIQGPEDGAACVPPLLELVRRASDQGVAAIIIGCFDDTGLAEARALATCPVIGIGQAAYAFASLIGDRFSVVTTLSISVPILEANVYSYGHSASLVRIRASEVPVLALEADPEASRARIAQEMANAVAEDGVQSIVMGCAGMSGFEEALDPSSNVTLVDGVQVAARFCAMLQ